MRSDVINILLKELIKLSWLQQQVLPQEGTSNWIKQKLKMAKTFTW